MYNITTTIIKEDNSNTTNASSLILYLQLYGRIHQLYTLNSYVTELAYLKWTFKTFVTLRITFTDQSCESIRYTIKMRTARQIKIINSHIEGFVNIRRQLEILLDDIKYIIKRSESWLLENEECETFSKLNQVLDFEMESCLDRITKIADDREAPNVKGTLQDNIDRMPMLEQAVEISNENYLTLNTKLIKLSDTMSTKIKTLQEKLELQDENFETKYNTRFNEIMAELHSASDFIQAKTESFSEKNKETEQKLNAELNVRCKNVQSKLEDQIEAMIEKLKGYNTQLQTQTKIIGDLKQEKDCFTSKITQLENKLL
ncbi:hypothetical protein Btru_063703 [Bulinus truncatus]|nr:hypothetical protein Btru_063703 [Bulinus truncatus]